MKSITAQVLRAVEINITELTKDDLVLVDKEQLVTIALGLIELLKQRTCPISPVDVQIPVQAHPKKVKRRFGGHNKHLGTKTGKTSKYHYIDHLKKGGKFRAKVRIDNTIINLGLFVNEIDAALAVDAQLDELIDKKRPRNRDEFPEVMEAYQKAHK